MERRRTGASTRIWSTRRGTWSTCKGRADAEERRSPDRGGWLSQCSVSCLRDFRMRARPSGRRLDAAERRLLEFERRRFERLESAIGTVPEMVVQSGSMWMTMHGRCCSDVVAYEDVPDLEDGELVRFGDGSTSRRQRCPVNRRRAVDGVRGGEPSPPALPRIQVADGCEWKDFRLCGRSRRELALLPQVRSLRRGATALAG